ncbi:hypothetical protein H9P43_007101 [Blastocladiella emersonii ATCC 22665]|nr:hypothetical protein H9P43_007101 [Blastocladiella emersonii ATCC 22665]
MNPRTAHLLALVALIAVLVGQTAAQDASDATATTATASSSAVPTATGAPISDRARCENFSLTTTQCFPMGVNDPSGISKSVMLSQMDAKYCAAKCNADVKDMTDSALDKCGPLGPMGAMLGFFVPYHDAFCLRKDNKYCFMELAYGMIERKQNVTLLSQNPAAVDKSVLCTPCVEALLPKFDEMEATGNKIIAKNPGMKISFTSPSTLKIRSACGNKFNAASSTAAPASPAAGGSSSGSGTSAGSGSSTGATAAASSLVGQGAAVAAVVVALVALLA